MSDENKNKHASQSESGSSTCSASSKRALVCCFCGKAWSYDGCSPKNKLVKEAVDHESVCEKNPYTARIQELETALKDAAASLYARSRTNNEYIAAAYFKRVSIHSENAQEHTP